VFWQEKNKCWQIRLIITPMIVLITSNFSDSTKFRGLLNFYGKGQIRSSAQNSAAHGKLWALEMITLNHWREWWLCWTLCSSAQHDQPSVYWLKLIVFRTIRLLDLCNVCILYIIFMCQPVDCSTTLSVVYFTNKIPMISHQHFSAS